jgi:hypothetical protein
VTNGTSQLGAGVIWNIPTPLHSATAPFVASGRFPTNVNGATSSRHRRRWRAGN